MIKEYPVVHFVIDGPKLFNMMNHETIHCRLTDQDEKFVTVVMGDGKSLRLSKKGILKMGKPNTYKLSTWYLKNANGFVRYEIEKNLNLTDNSYPDTYRSIYA